MPQSLAQVYLHIVFSTKNRTPYFQDDDFSIQLYAYLAGLCNKRDCFAKQVGGYVDHVHILCSFSRQKTISELIKELKTTSTGWIRTNLSGASDFHWQSGYGIFSVSQSQLGTVQKYIESQKRHHSAMSFQDEFRKLLIRYNIEFDENYVWD